ncbi:unnamed protein product [Onchocerca flexuosa]|uniref:Uncharacterized protein n=1 Tax=Onchocerca flexuosa TaxID=387005 RepID=A0A183HF66_9BILA|nr:unnamed protein product [Onchocerca flexuosa]
MFQLCNFGFLAKKISFQMKAISRLHFIDWLKPLQFVISAHPAIGKRTFAVICIDHQSTLHTDIRHRSGCESFCP